MKYQKEYDEIREENKDKVLVEKVNRILSLKGQIESYAIKGLNGLFDQAMDEIKQLEDELKDEQ